MSKDLGKPDFDFPKMNIWLPKKDNQEIHPATMEVNFNTEIMYESRVYHGIMDYELKFIAKQRKEDNKIYCIIKFIRPNSEIVQIMTFKEWQTIDEYRQKVIEFEATFKSVFFECTLLTYEELKLAMKVVDEHRPKEKK